MRSSGRALLTLGEAAAIWRRAKSTGAEKRKRPSDSGTLSPSDKPCSSDSPESVAKDDDPKARASSSSEEESSSSVGNCGLRCSGSLGHELNSTRDPLIPDLGIPPPLAAKCVSPLAVQPPFPDAPCGQLKPVAAGSSGVKRVKFVDLPCPPVPPQSRGQVEINNEKVKENGVAHDCAVIGRLFGRSVAFLTLKAELERKWGKFGAFQIRRMSPNTFLCSFSTPEARERVIEGFPWMVAGQLIGVDRWHPSFHVGSEAPFLTPVWIKLPYLPLAFWDPDNLTRIAQSVGEPICIDGITAALERIEYARICVRVDLSKKLLVTTRIKSLVGEFDQPIIYEGLQILCYRCGSTCHRISDCPLGKSFAQLLSDKPEAVASQQQHEAPPPVLAPPRPAPSFSPPPPPVPAPPPVLEPNSRVEEWRIAGPRRRARTTGLRLQPIHPHSASSSAMELVPKLILHPPRASSREEAGPSPRQSPHRPASPGCSRTADLPPQHPRQPSSVVEANNSNAAHGGSPSASGHRGNSFGLLMHISEEEGIGDASPHVQ